MTRTASAGETSRSNTTSTDTPRRIPTALWSQANFALCVDTGGNIDLDLRELYRIRSEKRSLN